MPEINTAYPVFDWEIEQIKETGIRPDLIQKIISKHKAKAKHMQELYGRYRSDKNAVPIFDRRAKFDGQVNNRLCNDYFSEIIDTKVGYFSGREATYAYATDSDTQSEAKQSGTNTEELSGAVTDFIIRNNMADMDAEMTKLAAICGYVGQMLYIGDDGEENCMIVEPWECIILSRSRQMHAPDYAIRYYTTLTDKGKRIQVEFYDEVNIYSFIGTSESKLELSEAPRPHLFDSCPLWGVANNGEIMGDVERVMSLIDAYDRTMSDVNNEVEAFRNAYMYAKGARMDEKAVQGAQDSGMFLLPNTDAEIGFITKELDDAAIEHHLDRLEANIYRFAMSPNLSDQAFSGTTSGVAMKFKLFALETKCATFERKRMAAINYMFKVLASAWRKKQIELDPLEIVVQFKRNFPLDLLYEAQATAQFRGLISEHTRLSQLSFVDDVEYEITLMEDERDGIPHLAEDLPADEGVSGGGDPKQQPETVFDGASQDIGA